MNHKQTSPNQHIAEEIVDDIKLITLAKKYNTPLYIYDKKVIKNQYKKLKKIDSKIFYSIKANPFDDILQFLNDLDTYFEVVSLGELQKLKKNNIPFEKILFVG